MTTSDLGLILLVGAAVVLAAIVAARVAHGIGLPGLLVFLGLGVALGEAGAGVRFDSVGLAQALGLSALVLILAEGGLTTNWAHARAATPAALSLATAGVIVSVLVVAAAARWLLDLGWRDALLLGAVLAPTDAAAVFSVLRKLPLPPRLSGTLEGESGLNDPPAVLAVTLLSDIGHHPPSPVLIAGEIAWQLAAGAAIGVLAGALGAQVLRRVALPASGLYPIAILALRLDVALQAEALLLQQRRHRRRRHLVPGRGQRSGQVASAWSSAAAATRNPPRLRVHQRQQRVLQPRAHAGDPLAAARRDGTPRPSGSPPPSSSATPRDTVTALTSAAAATTLIPPWPRNPPLGAHQKPPLPLIQMREQRGELGRQRLLGIHGHRHTAACPVADQESKRYSFADAKLAPVGFHLGQCLRRLPAEGNYRLTGLTGSGAVNAADGNTDGAVPPGACRTSRSPVPKPAGTEADSVP